MSQKLVLIDGHSIMNRAFYGLPELTNQSGFHTNAIYGFLNIMFRILEDEQPDFLIVAFDVHAKTFRHAMFEEYKGTRKGMPEELREQIPVMKEVLKAMNILTVEKEGYEADDILGTLAKKAEKDGVEVSLVSGDRDLLQIASEHIKIRIPKTKKGSTTIEDYYAKDVKDLMQVTPLQFIDVKALMGDTSDNIPGVPKVGAKTAESLIVEYGSLDGLYEHIEEISKNSIRESLIENKELAYLCQKLATIKIDCELAYTYKDGAIKNFYTKEAYELYKKLEFKNLLNRFQLEDTMTKQTTAFVVEQIASYEELVSLLETAPEYVAVYPVLQENDLLGVSFCFEEDRAYVYMDPTYVTTDRVKELLKNFTGAHNVATYDIKKQYAFYDLNHVDGYFDVLIGAYLCNPLKNDYDIESIASGYLGELVKGYSEIFGKQSFDMAYMANGETFVEYMGICAKVIYKSGLVLQEKLVEYGMDKLMREVEMPLSLVLYDMEREGILVKREKLYEYGQALVSRITELEQSIHEAAGHDFNILSPKQLAVVLFEELQLPGGKKTKTGFSTAADVLEKLAMDHAIVRDVLEYRGLCKLKSTYADGLANYIETDGRIRTSFNQTITATGRISSTEPNLQNIPMRMELGRSIRKVFVPKDGYVFLDADYSQIELRVLAHMSEDEQLIEAYHMDQDIHRITASKVFHTPFEEVTDLQRRNAKAVNFGIVYGISSFGLSQDLSITPKEAAKYIEQYFETYPGVKNFLDKLVEDAKENGYITTMFGRRRPIPELSSSNFMQRSFGERVAMNSPIQGTAADIIKIAMIRVWKELKEKKYQSKLILQIHDELLIETEQSEIEAVQELLVRNMEEAVKLSVELQVEAHAGKDWYEAK